MRITEIELKNFKAFNGEFKFDLENSGKNLLIYGENGSGKSSFYEAIKVFFNSSRKSIDLNEFDNVFLSDQEKQNNSIKLTLSTNATKVNAFEYSKNTKTNNHDKIKGADKQSGFFDYKKLLRIYLHIDEPNLFELFVNEILADIENPLTKITFKDEYSTIKKNAKEHHLSNVYKGVHVKIKNFNDGMKTVLQELQPIVNEFLTYFENGVTIKFNFLDVKIDGKSVINGSININAAYFSEPVNKFNYFFNESRLSAIAICTYLAGIRQFPSSDDSSKLLFLDDVFIGMDNDNRLPLLSLINEKFIDEKNYQFIITTYDKYFFELAKHWFENNSVDVICYEMFCGKDMENNYQDEIVVLPHEDYYQKAIAYFKKNDYPSAGNYLRKECESIFNRLLPDTYKVNSNGEYLNELEWLLNQLRKLYVDSGHEFPEDLINKLKLYRKLILNPTSHNDVKTPLFRKEIEDTINLIPQLRNLPKMNIATFLDENSDLTIDFSTLSYIMKIYPSDNILEYDLGGIKKYNYVEKYFIRNWKYKDIYFGHSDESNVKPLESSKVDKWLSEPHSIKRIFKAINGTIEIAIPQNMLEFVKIDAQKSLADLYK